MPIYEYICNECHRESEVLLRGSEKPVCGHCGSAKLDRKLSSFAVGRIAGSSSSCSCGGNPGAECDCGPVTGAGGCACSGRCGGH